MKLKTAIEYWDFLMESYGTTPTNRHHLAEFVRLNGKRMDFLKQPLQLGFFIPCDKDNKPLEKPIKEDMTYYQRLEEYQQACDRVLFEGFEILETAFSKTVGCRELVLYWYNDYGIWQLHDDYKTVESLSGKVDLVEKVSEQFKYE